MPEGPVIPFSVFAFQLKEIGLSMGYPWSGLHLQLNLVLPLMNTKELTAGLP